MEFCRSLSLTGNSGVPCAPHAGGGAKEVRLYLGCDDSNLGSREVNALAELRAMNGEAQTL
jgi:hypothetical protein